MMWLSKVVVGVAVLLCSAAESTQFTAEHSASDEVDVEVTRVVRQSHLLDQRSNVGVDEMAAPGRVGGVVSDAGVALGEAE